MMYEVGAFIFQTYRTIMYNLVGLRNRSVILLLHIMAYYGRVQDDRSIPKCSCEVCF